MNLKYWFNLPGNITQKPIRITFLRNYNHCNNLKIPKKLKFSQSKLKVKKPIYGFTSRVYGFTSRAREGCNYLLDSGAINRDYHKSVNGERPQYCGVKQLIPTSVKISGKCVAAIEMHHIIRCRETNIQIPREPNAEIFI